MKKLPIGISSLEQIIKDNFLYVDKTKVIYELIKGGSRRYFFSRPRRFGKSLTCSALKAIFSGNRDLFRDLWIGQSNYEFKSHPIISFDFSKIDHETPEILERELHNTVNFHAQKYGI